MKKHPHLTFLALLALTVVGCRAQTWTLIWDAYPNAQAAQLAGYNLYTQRPGVTNWTPLALGTNTSWTTPFTNVDYGQRWFITARNLQGLESPPSNVVTNTVLPTPENLRANHILKLPN